MVNFEEILDNSSVAVQENILDNLVISSSSTTTVVENTNFCDEETQDIENLIGRLPEEVLQKVGVHFGSAMQYSFLFLESNLPNN